MKMGTKKQKNGAGKNEKQVKKDLSIHFSFLKANHPIGRIGSPILPPRPFLPICPRAQSYVFSPMWRFLGTIFMLGGILLAQAPTNGDQARRRTVDALNDHAWSLAKSAPDSARILADSAIALSSNHPEYGTGIINAHTLLAILDKDRGYYELSVEHSLAALLRAEIEGDSLRVSGCLNNLGVVAQQQGNYAKALSYFQRSLAIEREYGDHPAQRSIRLFNIGEAFEKLDSLEAAYAYYYNTLLIEEELGSAEGILYARLGIGKVDARMGNPSKAAQELERARKLAEETHNRPAWGEIQLAWGKNELLRGDITAAEAAFGQVLDTAQAYGYQKLKSEALKGLYQLKRKKGDYKAALEYQESFLELEAALSSAKVSGRIGELETRYEVDKKNLELEGLRGEKANFEQDLEKLERQRIWLIGLVIFALVLGWWFGRKWKRIGPRGEAPQGETQALTSSQSPQEDKPVPMFRLEGGRKGQVREIPLPHIIQIEAADNYCKVYYLKGEQVEMEMLRARMKEMETAVAASPDFFRCHRSHLINGKMVASISGPSQAQRLHLKYGLEPIRVSRAFDLTPIHNLLTQSPN